MNECPMLIGVIGCAPEEETGFSLSAYRPQVLQRGALLVDTNKRSTLENILETLHGFKQEWNRNEQLLVPFDVCQSTVLCPDVLVEISQYLWLNEAVNAFSISLLPMFRDAHAKLHPNNPSDRFVKLIPEYLDPSQIVSLRSYSNVRTYIYKNSFSSNFDGLVRLTLLNR